MEILNGKLVAQEIKENAKLRAGMLKTQPCLACVIVEGDKASEIYVASKEKACKENGLISQIVRLPNDVSQLKLESTICRLNADSKISAILLQLPLPKGLDEEKAIKMISPEKDADCLTPENFGRLALGQSTYAPCTASGIIKLLDRYNIQIEGKRVVVIGRSALVGKPISNLLERRNATVTLCHSRTQNLPEITRQADILVVAIGRDRFITADYVKEGAVVVDVGINRVDGKIYGDVNFDEVKDKCSYITPVPGGVGPLTVACLLDNTVTLAERAEKEQ